MKYIMELTSEEAALLMYLLLTKHKEIMMWKAATGRDERDEEYYGIGELLKNLHIAKGD